MMFSSFSFLWLFFPAVFLIYYLLPERRRWRNSFLLLASLVFYGWGQAEAVFLLVICIIVNYCFGRVIAGQQERRRKLFLVLSLVFNIAVLSYFKYFAFIIETINNITGSNISISDVIVPIGVSYYVFKSISYLVDVYKEKTTAQNNIISLGLYIAFFPHIMSGPIAQYSEMTNEINNARKVSVEKIAYGVKRFILGFGKKILIADQLGKFVDTIWGLNNHLVPGTWYWLAMLCYTLQLYYDFSGYSDMAIGLGEMFGFSIKENFNYPYLSCSLREFWRRWHMSLNRWFQQYIYFPLGGSRKGKARTMINLLIVFLITGIWHGAGLTFIVWGLWHGLFMILERGRFGKWLDSPKGKKIGHIYTLLVVALGWVIFRSSSINEAARILSSMFSFPSIGTHNPLAFYFQPHVVYVLFVSVMLCGPIQKITGLTSDKPGTRSVSIIQTIGLLLLFVSCIFVSISGTYSSFIYFKF